MAEKQTNNFWDGAEKQRNSILLWSTKQNRKPEALFHVAQLKSIDMPKRFLLPLFSVALKLTADKMPQKDFFSADCFKT